MPQNSSIFGDQQQSAQDTIVVDAARLNTPLEIQAERVASIGSEVDPDLTFTKIAGVALDDQSNIYVLDVFTSEVRAFDAHGHFLRRFGRRGQGPGEFVNPRGVALISDSVLVVDDAIEMFDKDGNFARNIQSPAFDVRYIEKVWGGTHAAFFQNIVRVSMAGGTGPDTILVRKLEMRTGAISSPIVRARRLSTSFAGGVYSTHPLATPEAVAVSGSGRIFRVVGDSFHIEVTDTNSLPAARIVSKIPRVRANKKDLQDDLNYRASMMSINSAVGRGIDTDAFAASFQATEHSSYRQVLGKLVASYEGAILAQRLDMGESPYAWREDAVATWLLLNPEYKPVGRVLLPSMFEPMAFRGCILAGVHKDRDGVATVAVYRLSPAAGSAMAC
jgi:hypothetical protein